MPDINKISKNNYYVYLILFFAAVIPYIGSIRGEFVFDDIPLLAQDMFYYESHPFTDCWKRDFWKESLAQGLYRPFTIFSYWLNVKITGMHSPPFRAVNLVLHLLTVFIAFNLALRLKLGRTASLLAVVIFAVHPLHSEAVIPTFGRGELLCGLFVFTGLFLHTYVIKNPLYSIGTAACLILACWSKEHGVALLPLCLFYDFYSGGLKSKELFHQKGVRVYYVYIFAIVIVVLTRFIAMGTIFPAMTKFDAFVDNQLALCTFPVRILSAINIQGLALFKFIWPQTLSHDYSYSQLLPLESVFDLAGAGLVIFILSIPFILVFMFPALKKKIIFFFLSYLICILPSANIITPTGTIFAERLYYIPSIWLCFAVACILVRASWKMDRRLFTVFLVAIVVFLGVRTYVRSTDWNDPLSLALAGVRTSPQSVKTWIALGGQFAESNSYKEAIFALDKAIEIYPSCKMALNHRAFYNTKLGNFDSAEKDLRKVISLGTNKPDIYNRLGAILANIGKPTEALKLWNISLFLDGKQEHIKEALNDLQNEINLEEKKNDTQR